MQSRKDTGKGANHPYLQPVAYLYTNDADQRDKVERHIQVAFGSSHTTTNHRSKLRYTGVDYTYTEGGKPENTEKNPGITGEIDQLLYNNFPTRVPSSENQHAGQVVIHPGTTPLDRD